MNINYKGERHAKNGEWIELWNLASEVDYYLSEAAPNLIPGVLASVDSLEIKLRRLASYVHMQRTGDLTSAIRMLAIKPPGMSMDLAPEWLVDEATAFSKSEFQRSQRASRGRGRGRGKGQGKSESGANGASTAAGATARGGGRF